MRKRCGIDSERNEITASDSVSPKKLFCKLRMVTEAKKAQACHYVENAIPPENVNKIFCKSSESMEELPENSVHLVVASPAYNCGQHYDQDLTLDEYLEFMKKVFREIFRVLLPGRRFAINIAGLWRQPYIPLHHYITRLAVDVGFLNRGEIVWVKGRGKNRSCAWGSWMSASNPSIRDIHEYVIVFSKHFFRRLTAGTSRISKEEFCSNTLSIWQITPESRTRVAHPAPFPEALVESLVRLYTYSSETILDPFLGSGTTTVVALRNGRVFIGYETDHANVAPSKRRIDKAHRGFGLDSTVDESTNHNGPKNERARNQGF